eukprot:14848-Chlamydomonas_euryale.AAC.1
MRLLCCGAARCVALPHRSAAVRPHARVVCLCSTAAVHGAHLAAPRHAAQTTPPTCPPILSPHARCTALP